MAVVVAVTVALLWRMGAFSHELVLPIDDGYIHLSLARTLAGDGVWAIDPAQDFESASSSPGWIVVLATAIALVGPSVWVPVLVNVALSGGFTARIARYLLGQGVPAGISALLTIAITLAAPLPSMTTLAMEHVLHAWLAFELLVALERWIETRAGGGSALAFAACAAIVRYETMFLVAPAAAVLLTRRRPADAIALLAAAASLATAFGVFSTAHAGWFVPTSVVVKASIGSRIDHIVENATNLGLMVPLASAAWLALLTRRPAVTVFAIACALQLVLARTGWAYRYEAWCIAAGLPLVVPLLWREIGHVRRAVVICIAFTLVAPRAIRSMVLTPAGSRDVYTVWVVPARVISSMPAGAIGANALGALAWENPDRPILDLDGLKDVDVARHWLDGSWSDSDLESLTARSGAEVLFLSSGWFQSVGREGPPADWTLVATWRVHTHYVDATLYSRFYATTPEAAKSVEAALRRAEPQLPVEISIQYEPAD